MPSSNSPEPNSPGPNSNAQSKPKATAQQSFQDSQIAFAAHIRHPELHEAPADLEDRRLAIYRDLFYNNIEGFLASGFPVLRSILGDSLWHRMVRDFIHSHQSHSPYFLQISEEFLGYLKDERQVQASDPAFMLELAHYEWVELALDVSTLKIPEEQPEVVSEETSEATPENHPAQRANDKTMNSGFRTAKYDTHTLANNNAPAPLCVASQCSLARRCRFNQQSPICCRCE